jgi:hypothetical protein
VDRRHVTGDPHLQVTEFDLDFGQIGVVQDPGEIADELLVNIRFLCRHIETFFLLSRGSTAAQR